MSTFGKNCVCSHYTPISPSEISFNPGKEKKKVDKSVAQAKGAGTSEITFSVEELRAALETIRKEGPLPRTVEAQEKYFMTQVGLGEQLSEQG
jgi:hypothetical protein